MAELLNAAGDFVDGEELALVRQVSAEVKGGARTLEASAKVQLDAFEQTHAVAGNRFKNMAVKAGEWAVLPAVPLAVGYLAALPPIWEGAAILTVGAAVVGAGVGLFED